MLFEKNKRLKLVLIFVKSHSIPLLHKEIRSLNSRYFVKLFKVPFTLDNYQCWDSYFLKVHITHYLQQNYLVTVTYYP